MHYCEECSGASELWRTPGAVPDHHVEVQGYGRTRETRDRGGVESDLQD